MKFKNIKHKFKVPYIGRMDYSLVMKKRLMAWGDSKVIPIVGLFAFNEQNELLLLKRHKDDLGGGQWGTPGGRIDKGEDELTAILREVFEETGIRNINVEKLGIHEIIMPHGAVIMTSFITRLPSNTAIIIDPEEHHAYKWFNLENLLSESNILWGIPSVLRDFELMNNFSEDPTLKDGSVAVFLEKFQKTA